MPSSLATATTSSTSGTAYMVSLLFGAHCLAGTCSERWAPQYSWIYLAGHELSVGRRAQQLAVGHHYLPSQDHRRRPALDLPALPGRIVPDVQVGHAQRLLDGRIDDGDVGVAANGDGALLRIEAQQLGGVGGGDGRVILERHPPPHHRFRVVEPHTDLDADVTA